MGSQTDLDERVTDFEFGWLVGILEGEGTFQYTHKYTHRVTVSMGDEDTIDRVINIMSRLIHDYVAKGEVIPIKVEYSTMYTANISGQRARRLMRIVVKHMSYRRRQRIWQCLNKFNPKQKPFFDLSAALQRIRK